MTSDPDWQVRARAISAIGAQHEQSLLPEVHRALKDEATFVRERASRVLQTLGDKSSLTPVSEALSSEPDPAVRGNLAEALAKIGGASEIGRLSEVLQDDRDPGVRARTAQVLGDLGEVARPALERSAAGDPDANVRATASAALQRLR